MKVAVGALIPLRELTAPMLTEAVSAGFYPSENFPEKFPRLQILTIGELLDGKQLRFPRQRGSHAIYVRVSDKARVVIPMHSGDLNRKTESSPT